MIVFDEFKTELENLDPRVSIIRNQNYPQLANIVLDGINICSIPSGEIKEYTDPGYTIQFSNGFICKHRSRPEALDLVRNTLKMIETPEGKDIFFSKE